MNRLHNVREYENLLEEHGLLLESDVSAENADEIISQIGFNSLEVRNNSMFICKGAHFQDSYLEDAINRGAAVYVAERRYDLSRFDLRSGQAIPGIIVSDVRKAMALIADYYYNQVWKKLSLIGITGTKGKSTTAYYVKYILDDFVAEQKGQKTAIISSIENYDGKIFEESRLTTPEAITLHRHFNNAAKQDIEYLTMEVSSQGLKYDRVMNVRFKVGCFLNIGIDHISDVEHSGFEDYFSSKLKLFEHSDIGCVNLDSDYADRVVAAAMEYSDRVISFSRDPQKKADIQASDIRFDRNGTTFKVTSDSFEKEFKLMMPGIFNIENALAAISISYALNIPLHNIYNGLKKARVSGRMELFHDPGSDKMVLVDYAHNKMSFENLFKAMAGEFPNRKIFIVFGCPGKKAFGRRKELGEIAGRYAAKSYITEEDAGEEAVLAISEEIASHVIAQGGECEIIEDRGEAIAKAISDADDNTLILITGKGRETRHKRGVVYEETPSDVELVERALGCKF